MAALYLEWFLWNNNLMVVEHHAFLLHHYATMRVNISLMSTCSLRVDVDEDLS